MPEQPEHGSGEADAPPPPAPPEFKIRPAADFVPPEPPPLPEPAEPVLSADDELRKLLGTAVPDPERAKPGPSVVAVAARILLAAALLVPLLGSLLALYWAETLLGRCAAAAPAIISACAMIAARYGWPWRFRRRRRRALFAMAVAMALVMAGALVLAAPEGTGGDDGLVVEHVFVVGGFRRHALSNIVPEADQVAMGIGLAGWLDPLLGSPKATRVRRLAMPLYESMAGDVAFREMGSVMGRAYAELRGRPPEAGHYVAVVPRTPMGVAPPAVIFLHGSGGNFSVYWHVLARLARDHGIAVVCPSFGCGNWQREGGVAWALAAADDATARFRLDPGRMYVAALSNGGRGVTRLVAARPGRFRGVILISPVLEEAPIARGAEAGAWRGMRVLLFQGARDERVPMGQVREEYRRIESAGATGTPVIFAEENHFLFFSQRRAVLDRIASWVKVGEGDEVDWGGDSGYTGPTMR